MKVDPSFFEPEEIPWDDMLAHLDSLKLDIDKAPAFCRQVLMHKYDLPDHMMAQVLSDLAIHKYRKENP